MLWTRVRFPASPNFGVIMSHFNEVTADIKATVAKEKVVVGCSGGKDSKAVVGLLLDAGVRADNIVISYIDHGIRAESNIEMLRVAEWASSLGCVFHGVQVSLVNSSENEAREARRLALLDIAKARKAKFLVLAHTATDQFETVLMRMVRGTGLRGLGAMRKCVDMDGVTIYRPLLRIPSRMVLEYVCSKGWDVIADPTNDTDIYTRNRYRRHVLPLLFNENKNADIAVAKMTETLQEDNDALEYFTEVLWNKAVITPQNHLHTYSILDSPKSLQRRLLRKFWRIHTSTPNKQLTYCHIDDALHVVHKGSGKVYLPGMILSVDKGVVSAIK